MKWRVWLVLVAACAGNARAPGADVLSALDQHSASLGALHLRCSEADAEVLVDGVPQGRCDDFSGHPRGLSLQPGLRHIEVRKPGFAAWETWVQPERTKIAIEVELTARGDN